MQRYLPSFWTVLLVIGLFACAPDAEQELAPDAVPDEVPADTLAILETEHGQATFYADILDRNLTASGEPLDQNDLVAAHRRFPFGTILRVTNLDNERSVDVRVIDRGPFGASQKARETVIDLSRRAAQQLDFLQEGRALVQVDVLEYGEGLPVE